MQAQEHDARLARERVRGAVPMVHVPVHDEHAGGVAARERVRGGRGDVVEEAEPARLAPRAVVPGRTHDRERVQRAPAVGGARRAHRADDAARREPRSESRGGAVVRVRAHLVRVPERLALRGVRRDFRRASQRHAVSARRHLPCQRVDERDVLRAVHALRPGARPPRARDAPRPHHASNNEGARTSSSSSDAGSDAMTVHRSNRPLARRRPKALRARVGCSTWSGGPACASIRSSNKMSVRGNDAAAAVAAPGAAGAAEVPSRCGRTALPMTGAWMNRPPGFSVCRKSAVPATPWLSPSRKSIS